MCTDDSAYVGEYAGMYRFDFIRPITVQQTFAFAGYRSGNNSGSDVNDLSMIYSRTENKIELHLKRKLKEYFRSIIVCS